MSEQFSNFWKLVFRSVIIFMASPTNSLQFGPSPVGSTKVCTVFVATSPELKCTGECPAPRDGENERVHGRVGKWIDLVGKHSRHHDTLDIHQSNFCRCSLLFFFKIYFMDVYCYFLLVLVVSLGILILASLFIKGYSEQLEFGGWHRWHSKELLWTTTCSF